MSARDDNYIGSEKTGTEDDPSFIETSDPKRVTKETLRKCTEQEDLSKNGEEKELYILVARIDGIFSRGPNPIKHWDEGSILLYMNANKEAVERDMYINHNDWDQVPRSIYGPKDIGKEGSERMKRALKEVTKYHKEIKKEESGEREN